MEDVRTIKIFGKDIPIRKYGCKNQYMEKPSFIEIPFVNLFVQTINVCNANCDFCIYHDNKPSFFDIEKYSMILKELSSSNDFLIGKLNFTGGEPTLDKSLFHEILSSTKENLDLNKKPEVTLNTNGYNLFEALRYDDFLDSIGLSRHHYSDDLNSQIFRSNNVPLDEDIKEFVKKLNNKKILQLRCNLISGYIDCYSEMINYMNKAIDMGVHDCGFVTLAPNNNFCKTHQIDFNSLVKLNDDLMKVNGWNRLDDNDFNVCHCECANYVYSNENGDFCKFYSRLFCKNDLKEGMLVFDGKFLRFGFGGEIII